MSTEELTLICPRCGGQKRNHHWNLCEACWDAWVGVFCELVQEADQREQKAYERFVSEKPYPEMPR